MTDDDPIRFPGSTVHETRWFPLRAEGERARDLVASWPSFRITVELGVWHWAIRPRVYVDDLTRGPDRTRGGSPMSTFKMPDRRRGRS